MSADEHKGLVPVVEQVLAGVRVQTVDARDLHKALGVKRDFTTWAKQQLTRLRLVADRDYLLTQQRDDGFAIPLRHGPDSNIHRTLNAPWP
jgi:phage anti-repressor protein